MPGTSLGSSQSTQHLFLTSLWGGIGEIYLWHPCPHRITRPRAHSSREQPKPELDSATSLCIICLSHKTLSRSLGLWRKRKLAAEPQSWLRRRQPVDSTASEIRWHPHGGSSRQLLLGSPQLSRRQQPHTKVYNLYRTTGAAWELSQKTAIMYEARGREQQTIPQKFTRLW